MKSSAINCPNTCEQDCSCANFVLPAIVHYYFGGKIDFKAKQPSRSHSKEEKKKQEREWKERRRLER